MNIKLMLLISFLILGCNKENEKNKESSEIINHPLSIYFVPHGTQALLYIGDFWNSCDEINFSYTEEGCDKAVERGIRIGKSVGIELDRNDLVNEKYWKKFREVDQERIAYLKEHVHSKSMARLTNGDSEYEVSRKKFKEQQKEIMKNMDEDYGS